MQKLGKFFLILALLTIPFQLGKHFWLPFSYVWGLPIDYLAPTVYLNDIFLLITVFIKFFFGLTGAPPSPPAGGPPRRSDSVFSAGALASWPLGTWDNFFW